MKVQKFTRKRYQPSIILCWLLFTSFLLPPASASPHGEIEKIGLEEAFLRISEKYHAYFNYDRSITMDIEVDYKDDLHHSLDEALSYVLKNTDLGYRIYDERYVVVFQNNDQGIESLKNMIGHMQGLVNERDKRRKKLAIPSLPRLNTLTANELYQKRIIFNVTGTITDQDGEPLIGVNIQVKGTNKGVATDIEGRFVLEDIDENAVLVVSYIGYQTQEVALAGNTNLVITLLSDSHLLDEVVVVGYGVQKKVNLTGAMSTLDNENITSRPATNITSLLQGQIPGVTISQSSGLPGLEGTSILIRGLGTMNNSQPLIIVDGMESGMNDINPYDVETISVLKDAASASIYGSRAANGVILITTKRGQEGTPTISYNTYAGWQEATRLPEFLGSAGYARLLNEANQNEGIPPRYTEEEIRLYETGEDPYNYPNVDWYKALLQESGFNQNHNLQVSGGNNNSKYSISLGFNEQNALIKKGINKRYNIRANFDNRIREHILTGLNFAISRGDNSMPTAPFSGHIGTFFDEMIRIPPTQLNKYEDGSWASHLDGNPNAWIEEGGSNAIQTDHLIGSIFLKAEFIEDFSLKVRAGLDQTTRNQKIKLNEITYGNGFYQGPSSVGVYLYGDRMYDVEAVLNYETRFSSHGISGLLGTSSRSEYFSYTNAYRRELPSNQLSALNAGSPEGMSNSGSESEVKLSSGFGRINYDFDNKYLFESNLRIDGSSKFAEGYRWGIFPSFSAGWIVTREKFMANIHWLSFLKIRASWGKLGNHRINDYLFMPLISLGQNYPFGGTVADGAAQLAANTPDISWEVTTEKNIGLDMQFFQNALSTSVNIYERYTDDILTYVPVSEFFGLPAPIVNAGAMSNKGVEVNIGFFSSKPGSMQYNISLNAAYNKNKVEKFENPSIGDYLQIEGESWNSLFGYEWIGYFYSDEEAANGPIHHPNVSAGDLKFNDQNNDGVINGEDRIVLGNTIPELTFGVNLGMTYKQFDLGVFFQGADRVYRRLSDRGQWPFVNAGKAMKAHLDRMIVENGKVVKEGYFPRTLVQFNHHNAQPLNSFQVHDAAYLRLKNLQIGYSLPLSGIDSVSISKARIYFSGQNLLTVTRHDFPNYADPESADGIGGGGFYPQVKFFTFGVDINF